jgi:hypothetical protein
VTDEVFAEHSLRNRFNNIYTKRKRDALGPNNWVPLGIDLDGRQSRTVDDYS